MKNFVFKTIGALIIALPVVGLISLMTNHEPLHIKGHEAHIRGEEAALSWVNDLDWGKRSTDYYTDQVAAKHATADTDVDDKAQYIAGFLQGCMEGDCRKSVWEDKTGREIWNKVARENGLKP